MKINRLIRVIAIILVVSMLPLWLLGCGKVSGKVSERLVEMMVGDGKLNDKNEYTKEYLAELDAEVTNLRLYYDAKNGYWDLENLEPGSTFWGVSYENFYKMLMAWSSKDSEHYHDSKIIKMVKSGLEYMYKHPMGPYNETWFDWINGRLTEKERLDAAEYLVRTLLILRENGKISKSKAEEYGLAADEAVGSPYGTGVNLARSAYISVAYASLIGDDEKLEKAIEKLGSIAVTVTNGAGLYADGSFIADIKIAASGSYGVIAYSELIEIAYAIQGEACDFKKELKIPEYLYNWTVNSIIPSLYNGRAFAATSSSYVIDAEGIGGRAVSSILALANYFENADNDKLANELRGYVKGYSKAAGADFHKHLTTFGATEYEDLMKDKDLKAKTVEGAFSFAASDKLNILGPKYSASLSMSSYRTAKYETRDNLFEHEIDTAIFEPINGNNWYSGDGMLMIYTATYAPTATYWKYVNGQRLPGTTVASIERAFSAHDGSTGNRYEAGSVTLDTFAVSAFYSTANNTDYLSTVKAKKSWFFFDGEIIALGAGIESGEDRFGAEDYRVETVIENIFYGNFDSISTAVEIEKDQKLSNGREDVAVSDAIFALGYGGIYAPADKNDTLMYGLKKTDGGNFVEVWLDHTEDDADPNTFSGKTYEYVIVPSTSMDAQTFFGYVGAIKDGSAPGYTVLSNTEQVQAVKDASSGVVGYTFWESASVNGVSSDFACSVIVKETDTTITVSIADFTHTASDVAGHIDLGITGAVASASEGLTMNGTVLEVNRNIAASGNTLTIVINK